MITGTDGSMRSMGQPLDGLKVVEWGDGRIAAYATKLLSDFGAAVTLLLEAQSGRQTALYGGGDWTRDNLALESFLDGAKQRVDIELDEDGQGQVLQALGNADVLVLQHHLPRIEALGLSPESISDRFPALVVVAVTLAGLTPLGRSLRHSDLVASAISGIAGATPPRRSQPHTLPPLKIGGYQADYTTGLVAATAALTGLRQRRTGVRGLLQDVSAQAVMASFMRHDIAWETYNSPLPASIRRSLARGSVPCKDGLFSFHAAEQYQWDGLKRMIGSPSWSMEQRFLAVEDGIANWDSFEPRFLEWARDHTKYEIFQSGQRHRVPVSPLNDVGDFQRDEHEVFRKFFYDTKVAGSHGPVQMPGALVHVQNTPSDNDPGTEWMDTTGQQRADEDVKMTPLPLEGIRVADFSWVVAGPYCTAHLAALGAEVIKIESSLHTDISRRNAPFADGLRGEERSGQNHSYSLGKRSVTLNLAHPDAQELALEIIRRSDIVIENFAHGVLEHFNLGYERLRQVNPNIIFVTSTGFGRRGPYRGFVTYVGPLQAFAGILSVTGQDGGEPQSGLGGVWADHLTGVTSLFGLMLALEAREQFGMGQMVEVSMAEAVAAQLPEAFAEYGSTGEAPSPRGNRDSRAVPHAIYPARGDDAWVAIAVLTDDDWFTFRDVVPGPSWWLSAELECLPGRLARESELNRVVSEWSVTLDPTEAAHLLQSRGLSAGAVNTVHDLVVDPVLREREFFLSFEHPEVGRREVAGIGWRFPGPTPQLSPPPLLGEDNWEVFVEWLGISPERFAWLAGEGIIQ